MEITVLPVASLRPYNENYRHHEADQIEHLSASVDEFGQYKPIVVSQDHVILAGHGIWQTHQAKGLSDIACVVMPFDHKDPKAEKLLVVDNESARLARDDSKQLTALLADIQRTEGLQGTGWSDQELDRLIGEMAAEDFGASVGREEKFPDEFKEVDPTNDDFECRCPRCGFEWNR